MDKNTLSNYGWVVIAVLILSVMIALATPFGNFIANSFKSTYIGFDNTNSNALQIISKENDNSNNATGINCPIKFKQPYSMIIPMSENSELEMCFVFYEEGKATYFANGTHNAPNVFPTYDVIYSGNIITIKSIYNTSYDFGEMTLLVSDDGEKVYMDPDDTENYFSIGSKYSIPIDIDVYSTTDIPTFEMDYAHQNGLYVDKYKFSKCDTFKGIVFVEFYGFTPTNNTDTTKHMWGSNSLTIQQYLLTEDYEIELIQNFDGEMNCGYFWTSSGYYILQFNS